MTRWLGALAASLAITAAAPGQLRVMNYNIAQLQGDNGAVQAVIAGAMDDDSTGVAIAPHLFMFQEVESGNVADLVNMINAEAPAGVTYSLATYTNNNENVAAGAQALVFRDDVLAEDPAGHVDIDTFAGRQADRWLLRLVGYDHPDAEFYVYSMHLKASQGTANQDLRHDGVINVRADADALGNGVHAIYAGDMNFYNENEDGYDEFISAGAGQAVDPLGSGVDWNGASNAFKHSQSPRTIQAMNLANGGMDDRFDFQLSTGEFHDGQGLAFIAGSYRSLGNDGNHFDVAINDGNNSYFPGDVPRSNALADAIHDASDHLPVIAEYTIPGLIGSSLDADFGRVIQGGIVDLPFSIFNAAPVDVASGSESFSYVASPAGALGGSPLAGTLDPLGPADMTTFTVDTSTFGALVASVDVSVTSGNQGMPASELIESFGTVVRHADGSFSDAADQDTITVVWPVDANIGVVTRDVDVHNFGYDANQALLDIDSVSVGAAPFQFVGGLASGIGAVPATLTFSFQTNGATAGSHFETFQIEVRDEAIPGADGPSFITLDFEVVVDDPIPGDLNSDGQVTIDDLCIWHDNPIDLDGDMVVDDGDRDWLLALIPAPLVDTNGNGIHDDCEVLQPLLSINEIRIDQPGGDVEEYFELKGTPGTSLDGLTYLVIGDATGAGSGGGIEVALDLSGHTIGPGGLFLVAEDTDTLGVVADFVTGGSNMLNFENNDNVTHLLVAGFSAGIGTDVDTNDDGLLDVTPWTAVIDMVALVEEPNPPAGTEFYYGTVTVGPDGSNVPGHVWRCQDTGDWMIGAFAIGTDDTPGAPNATCGPCLGDTDANGVVDIDDIVNVILDFGTDGLANGGDVDASGIVDIDDVVVVVLNFGPCS